jgi:putative ABC transport system substrate-binding protein
MRRRVLLAGAATLAFAGGVRAQAVRRVGVLFPGVMGETRIELARKGIAEALGAGTPFTIDARSAEGDPARLRAFAAEFAAPGTVDVILAIGSLALAEARRIATTTPIVALDLETDPLASGAAASLARPGGNVTGVFFDAPEIAGKWLQFLTETIPGLARVALLYDAQTDTTQLAAGEDAARRLGIETRRFGVADAANLPTMFDALAASNVGAVLAHSSPIFVDNAERIAALALQHRLPSLMLFPIYAKVGGLLSYGPDNFALFAQVGAMVGKVLKGAKPAELPIERPTRFTLSVNLATARALGLTIPQSVVLLADEVID